LADPFIERRINRGLAARRLVVRGARGEIFHREVSTERVESATVDRVPRLRDRSMS
jgi:hypothetical protein